MSYTLAVFLVLVRLNSVSSSANGRLYACDATQLSSNNLCVFVAAGDAATAGEVMEKSVVNRDVGGVNSRMVVDKHGNQLTLSMRPWENKVAEAAATAGSITGNEWLYLLSYELLVPLRNAMMFEPGTVTTNEAEWTKLTKVMVDCKIKTATVSATPVDKYGTDGIYGVIKNPQQFSRGPSVHNPILQYIEEASADLWCAMTGENLSANHCPAVWTALGTGEGQTSTCWQAAYDGLYGSGAATAALGSTDNSTASGSASVNGSRDTRFRIWQWLLLGLFVLLSGSWC